MTNVERELLDEQILEVLRQDRPQSVRHIFYRITNPNLEAPVAKSEKGYLKVQRRCLALRRSGRLPYSWIIDMSRSGYHVDTFSGVSDFINRVRSLYRADLWNEDLPHAEVWCESRSIASVLVRDCRELAISLYPSSGYASASFAYAAAQGIDSHERDWAQVFYVGDFDPAVLTIDKSIEAELRKHLTTPLQFERLAINEEQIREYDLPGKPRKATDRLRSDILETVEAEALPAHILRRIVRDSVENLLPAGALAAAKLVEREERKTLLQLVKDQDSNFNTPGC